MPPTAAPTPYPFPDIAAAIARGLHHANDLPQPGEDAARSSLKYPGMSQDFRTGAWHHLDDGDLPQASNRAWGLVAETVKAISAEHGRFLHTHRSIIEVVWELARLSRNAGDVAAARELNRKFALARSLHANFYENELPQDVILEWLIDCEEVSQQLYALFWPEGASQTAPAA